jgi:signal transduction histidine kinase
MLPESKGLDKYQKLLNWYAVISVCYILFSLIFPALSKSGSRPNVILYATVRIIIVSVSFVFYIQLMKNLSNIYFRYLFAGCSLLLVFALLALWDSTVNRENSNLKGFQFISIGYVLENLCFSAAFVYRIITVYREKQASEILYQKQLAFVQAESQQQTMKHIGTEIHDNVGQKLTLASLYTKQLAAGTIRNMENKITEVSNIIDESLTELRQLSKTLTNSDLANANLLMLLNEEARRINSSGICYISIDSHGGEFILPQTEKNILFRLLQEFIQNSLKHARCRKMDIILQKENEQLNITATDDGKGFDTTITSTGIGLQNMKRRAEQLNAIYQLNSEIGKGTSLTLQLSLAR